MYNRVKAMLTLSIMVLCLTGCDAQTSIVDIVTGEENGKQSTYESSSSVTDDTTSRNYEERSEENSNETKTDSTEKDFFHGLFISLFWHYFYPDGYGE